MQHEMKETKLNGGFTFFDTLTYSEKNVPEFLGIKIFKREDITKFFKRLRQNLLNAGYYVKIPYKDTYKKVVPFKYVVTSEYGGRTHRPHYHIIIYNSVPHVTPEILNQFIVQSWKLGLNQTHRVVKFKNGDHKVVLCKPQDKVVQGNEAIGYVTKYLCKDDDFVKEFNKHLDVLRDYYFNVLEKRNRLFEANYTIKDVDSWIDYCMKQFQPFSRQSNFIGSNLVTPDTDNFKRVFEKGLLTIPDTNKGHRDILLPEYFKRKLFFKLHKIDGSYCWRPNKLGIQWIENNLQKRIEETEKRFLGIIKNLPLYTFNNLDETRDCEYRINDLLDKHTFNELAIYKVCYKDRCLDSNYDYVDSFMSNYCYDGSINIQSRYKSMSKLDFKNWFYHMIQPTIMYDKRLDLENFDALITLFDKLQEQHNKYINHELRRKKQLKERQRYTNPTYRQYKAISKYYSTKIFDKLYGEIKNI